MKIESFTHKGLKQLYSSGRLKGVPAASRGKLQNMLGFLEAMTDPLELLSPILKWKTHELVGNRKGTWALRVTGESPPDVLGRWPTPAAGLGPRRLPLTCWRITMPMRNPPHPGQFVRDEIVEANGLSVTATAELLKVGRSAVSNLLNGNADLSPEMALRIEMAFGIRMDTLMAMQMAYDVAEVRRSASKIHVKPFVPAAGAWVRA